MFSGLPGAKIVFWDMRDSFLSYLYYGGVEGNRLDAVLPQFDKVRLLLPQSFKIMLYHVFFFSVDSLVAFYWKLSSTL